MAQDYPNWVNLCLEDIRRWTSDTDAKFESMIPMLYSKDTSQSQEEYDMSYAGVGKFVKLDGNTPKDNMNEEYKTTYTFPEWTNSIDITRRLYDWRKDRTVMSMAKEFKLSEKRTKEAHAAELFNYAFTATGTFSGGGLTAHADGKALCATDHTTKAEGFAGTYAGVNKGTSAISPAAVSATRDGIRNFTDGKGNKQYCTMDMILGPANKDFEEVAWEIISTTGKVDTADNNKNFHSGRYKLAIWQELTDHNNWFGLDSDKMRLYLWWLDQIPLELWDKFNPETQVLTYGGYMRYGFNANNWRFIYGHQVA